jgi:hypothetical protein
MDLHLACMVRCSSGRAAKQAFPTATRRAAHAAKSASGALEPVAESGRRSQRGAHLRRLPALGSQPLRLRAARPGPPALSHHLRGPGLWKPERMRGRRLVPALSSRPLVDASRLPALQGQIPSSSVAPHAHGERLRSEEIAFDIQESSDIRESSEFSSYDSG